MPAGTYTYTLYTITGSGNNSFTVTGSFTVTVYDSDDNLGVGDDAPGTETGAAPVILSLGAGAPAGWDVGDTFYFGGSRGIESGSPTDDYLIPKVDGAWQTSQTLYSLPGASIPLVVGQSYTRAGAAGNVDEEVLPCFVAGTQIRSLSGTIAIEELRIGDAVMTLDHGPQNIRWIGSSTRKAQANLAPICFRKGAIGNSRDLLVSPQHRILVRGWQAELLFGEAEVLIAAKSMLNDHSILRMPGGLVTYYHMAFDSHEIVFSQGVPSESYHPNANNIGGFDPDVQAEILELFPELVRNRQYAFASEARMSLRHKQGRMLSQMLA